jgi:DinB family protein
LQEAISLVAGTPAVVRSILEAVPEGALAPSERGTWGARQVLEHLIDVEGIAFRERIGRIVSEDDPLIRSIDPPARLDQGGYAAQSLGDLLDRFDQQRAESVGWLKRLSSADLERTGTHDQAGTIGAGELVHYWACHDLLHLRQLVTVLQDRMLPHIGNMHLFLEDG